MIEYFVDVAKECINIGNFNSLMAIIGQYPQYISLSTHGTQVCVQYTRVRTRYNRVQQKHPVLHPELP